MDNEIDRYYYEWVNGEGGINYNIIDHATHKVIDSATGYDEAQRKVKKLMESERAAIGIETVDQIEIPLTHNGNRNRDKIDIEPVKIHE